MDVVGRAAPETILIPGGEFMMGDDSKGDHSPAHRVYVDAFYIDAYEVTNAQYQVFCEDTGRDLPEFWGIEEFHCGEEFPDHPVIGVTWVDAKAYAEWRDMRLPTEAEWECAARGGLVGKAYPNGDDIDLETANYYKKGFVQGTVPVGSYPPNGYGLYDMAGNANEWVADRYAEDYYGRSPYENPKGPEKSRFRVLRGGGWHTGPGCTRVFYRGVLPAYWVDYNTGFRCAKDADAAQAEVPDARLGDSEMSSVENEIWQTVEAANRCWTEGDPQDLKDYFHTDMVAITPADKERLAGQDRCVAAWAGYADAVKILRWKTTDPDIRVFGTTAVVTYYYELEAEMDGEMVRPRGRDMMTLVKEAGRWWIVADQFSPDPKE
jgi:iron(II)-dependent oxidoreductase